MRIRKQIMLLALYIFVTKGLLAQSIDDGKKFLNYERYTSAQGVFSKILAAEPNNIEAAYWMGQAYLVNSDNPDTAAAKALYQKTLQANPNAPLMLVGNAEIALAEGRKEEALNGFNVAINLAKGKDLPVVLTAVGRANIDTKAGDATYAIDKLNQAAAKDKKNPQIQIALGDAYRKMIDGANATTAYNAALALDPKNARASFMIGRIFETQGFGQETIYMKYYNDAIAMDPNFAPVYYWLYNYYYRRDVNKSRDYLNKYIAVADPDSKNCYSVASILYASQLYKDAIAKSDECIAQAGAKPYPNLYGLKAYSYDKLGDSVNAKQFFDEFFAKINPDKIGPNDYATYAKVLLKFPGNDSLAAIYVDKAVAADTVVSNKLDYIKSTAESLAAAQKFASAGAFYTKILTLKPNYGKVDLYYAGYNDFRGGNYPAADSIFKLYQAKFPEDMFGWYMGAKSNEGIDTTGANGLAKPLYDKVIAIADTSADKEKVKPNLISAYKYMLAYSYNIKHDKVAAIEWNNKILALDPSDAQAVANDKALNAPVKNKTETTKEKTTPSKTKVKSR